MTSSEVNKIIFIVKAAYPKFYNNYTQRDYENLESVWMAVFDGYSYEQISKALMAYMRNDNGFPPTPGQLIPLVQKVQNTKALELPTAQEAWERVYYSICRSGYYADAEEEFNNLPNILKKCVGGPESLQSMALMEPKDLGTIEKSHFIKTYNSLMEQYKERVRLKEMLGQSKVEGIEQHE